MVKNFIEPVYSIHVKVLFNGKAEQEFISNWKTIESDCKVEKSIFHMGDLFSYKGEIRDDSDNVYYELQFNTAEDRYNAWMYLSEFFFKLKLNNKLECDKPNLPEVLFIKEK